MERKIFIKSIIGFIAAEIVINVFWSYFPSRLGIKGGWLSALLLTGTMWYINHYKGLVTNSTDAAFVDMGLAIGLSLIVRDIIKNGLSAFEGSVPTLICVLIGGIAGGIIGGLILKKQNGVKEDAV